MIRKHRISALVITFAALGIASIFFFVKISGISVPKKYLEKGIANISDTVKVFKNHYGIPHIITGNERDAFFMIGYMHAQDRLWQMDYLRRVAKGKLSEVFGYETLNIDKFMKALEITKISEKLYKNTDQHTRKIIDAYTEGINFYITNNQSRLPFEFNALNYMPEKWHPTDSYAISRLMAFSMNFSFNSDLTIGEISEKIGVTKALQLIPGYSNEFPAILDDSIPKKLLKSKQNDTLNKTIASITGIGNLFKEISDSYKNFAKFTGIEGSSAGSNSWVSKKSTNPQSGVILSNDPHLSVNMPSHWYQIHISYPGSNVIGFTMPGAPFFLVGRNSTISWGLTCLMADDCDFFIEKIDSSNQNLYYLTDGKKEKFKFTRDTIRIKNGNDLCYYRKSTRRSSVISDVSMLKYKDKEFNTKRTEKFYSKYCLTYSWTGQQISNEFSALYQVSKSHDWSQFQRSLNQWCSPGLCFTYADINGNQGVLPAGMLPKRNLTNPNIPNPAWMNGYQWEGFRYTYDLPRSYNPSKKFIVSANNKLSRSIPWYISSFWEPSSRSERISELLQIHTEYSSRDAQIIQGDQVSSYSRSILNVCLPILSSMQKYLTDKEKVALNLLKKWDNILTPVSVGASIYSQFIAKLLYNTFNDELGEDLFRNYLSNPSISLRKMQELIQDTTSSSEWFDDVKTQPREYKNFIIMKSLRDAVSYIENFLDEQDINKWTYGKLHTITFRHPFSRNKFLQPSVNAGPYEIGGDVTTVNNSGYRYDELFDVATYASMRFVSDMEENVIYSVVPGGSSGDPMSPNYKDQLQLWLNGGYVQLGVGPVPDNSFSLGILFYPK